MLGESTSSQGSVSLNIFQSTVTVQNIWDLFETNKIRWLQTMRDLLPYIVLRSMHEPHLLGPLRWQFVYRSQARWVLELPGACCGLCQELVSSDALAKSVSFERLQRILDAGQGDLLGSPH